jgi:hypothetical protein
MARRASRDPEDLLRAHFAAEIAVARREAGPSPRPEDSSRSKEGSPDAEPRLQPAGKGERAGAWPRELAAAAVLILAFGLGVCTAPAQTGLSRAIAENTLGRGRAREVEAIIGRGVASAIVAFSRSCDPGSGMSGSPDGKRFR